jgi:hypothetical protein
MCDTLFSTRRFLPLMKKELMENWKQNAMRFALMYGALAILFVWQGYSEYRYTSFHNGKNIVEWEMGYYEVATFAFMMFVMGALSASFIMSPMKRKAGRINMLTLPATPFEKYIVRWLIYTVGFFVLYVIAYNLADLTRVIVYRVAYPDNEAIALADFFNHLVRESAHQPLGDTLVNDSDHLWLIGSAYLFVHSLFTLGSSLWPKNSFLRTFVTVLILIVAYTLVFLGLADWLITGHANIDISIETALWTSVSIHVLLALFFWTLAYYRYKESEIINRW